MGGTLGGAGLGNVAGPVKLEREGVGTLMCPTLSKVEVRLYQRHRQGQVGN